MNAGALDDLWVFCTLTLTWNRIEGEGSRPSARCGQGMAADDQSTYIFGGYKFGEGEKSFREQLFP